MKEPVGVHRPRAGAGLGEQRLELGDEIAFGRLPGQLHAGRPGAVETGIEAERAGIAGLRPREVAGELTRGGQVVEEARVVGIGGRSAFEQRQGAGMVAGAGEHHAKRIQGQGIGRGEGQRRLRGGERFGPAVKRDQRPGEVGMMPGDAGLQRPGPGEQLGGLGELAMVCAQYAQQEPGARVADVRVERRQAQGVRLLIVPAGQKNLGPIQLSSGIGHV